MGSFTINDFYNIYDHCLVSSPSRDRVGQGPSDHSQSLCRLQLHPEAEVALANLIGSNDFLKDFVPSCSELLATEVQRDCVVR